MSDSANWKRIEALFDEVLDQPADRRRQWLTERCADEPALLTEVMQLVRAHERAGGILEESLAGPTAEALSELDHPNLPLKTVGPYRLEDEVGRGGMGRVFRAFDSRLQRRVAIKFLPPHLSADARTQQRFLREARAASSLDHPNICTIHDLGETDDGQVYLVMAHYEGDTLAEWIAGGPVAVPESLDVAAQILAGLDAAHGAGVVHRDIKPANVMVTRSGVAKILDFGVAKLEGVDQTRPDGVVGTVAYMSPEQIGGHEVGPETDYWSLGVVLYELLTGERPFAGVDYASLAQSILHRVPPPPSHMRQGISGSVDRLVASLLARDSRARGVGVAELRRILDRDSAPVPVLRPTTDVPSLSPPRLPVHLTTFVGRDRELAELETLLVEGARLVTLVGPGGVGKSRLALQLVHRVGERFNDGIYWVRLAEVSDPELVAPEIGKALGVVESATRGIMAALEEALSNRRVLVVLDNFEHLVSTARQLAELLGMCTDLTLLVTSRTLLRLSGEQVYSVPSLTLPDADTPQDECGSTTASAISLFADRARAVRPSFQLDDQNADAVAEICSRVDGLPLAIELAAARLRILTPRQLLRQLERRLEALGAGPRDAPARHQTLRSTIAWSYELATEAQRKLLRRLALFQGGIPAEMVASVVEAAGGLDLSEGEGLVELVDQSLLAPDHREAASERFLMLDTIREFALERLQEAGEVKATQRAHTAAFLALAEEAEPHLTSKDQAEWLDRLELDHDDLRAAIDGSVESGEAETALRLGASLWRFWISRGYLREGRERLGRILNMETVGSAPRDRARVLNAAATLDHNFGDNRKAQQRLEESLVLWRDLGDEKGIGQVLSNLGWVACELSQLDRAEQLSSEALELHRRLGEVRGEATSLNNLAWAEAYRGRPRRAYKLFEQSLELRYRCKDLRGAAFGLCCIGWTQIVSGRLGSAARVISRAEKHLQRIGDPLLMAFVRLLQGQIELAAGRFDSAAVILEKGTRLAQASGNKSLLAWALCNLGTAHGLAGDDGDREGRAELEESIEIWREIGTLWGEGWTYGRLAGLDLARGRTAAARPSIRHSLQLAADCGNDLGVARSCELLLPLALDQARPEMAAQLLSMASGLRRWLETPAPNCQQVELDALEADLRAEIGAWPEIIVGDDNLLEQRDRALQLARTLAPETEPEPGEE